MGISSDTNYIKSLKEVYGFCQSYERNKSSVGKEKFTNLFLIHIGDKLEFVKRWSITTAWMRIVAFFHGKSDTTFNIDENLQRASTVFKDVFSKLPLDNKDELNAIASQLGIQGPNRGEILKGNIEGLKIYLDQLQSRVEKSRARAFDGKETGISVPIERKAEIFPLYAHRATSVYAAYRPEFQTKYKPIYEALKEASPLTSHLTDDEKDAVVHAIVTSGREQQVVNDLKGKKLDALLLALRSGQMLDAVRSSLDKLEPVQRSLEGVSSTFVAENFAPFLGARSDRGGQEMRFGAVKSVLQNYLLENPDEARSTLLNSAIELSETKSAQDLQSRLQHDLKHEGKCLLLGGHEGRPMVFMLKEQENGKYTCEVFNQEPEANLSSELLSTNDQKRGYLQIRDIEGEVLFGVSGVGATLWNAFAFTGAVESTKPTVLEALCTLSKKKVENPDEYFKVNFLEQLPQPEHGDGAFHHALRPEMPGTSASRALLAALSSSMENQNDADLFRAKVDLHLLQHFQAALVELNTKEINQVDYPRVSKLSYEMNRAFLECLARLKGVEGSHEVLAKTKDLLHRLDQKLIGCQKQFFTRPLTANVALEAPFTVVPPKWKSVPKDATTAEAEPFTPTPLRKEELEALQAIKQGPAQKALEKLAQLDPASGMYLFIVDAYFKKIGSLQALEKIQFDAPEQAEQQLKKVVGALSQKLSTESLESSKPEVYGAFLLAVHSLESVLKKQPADSTAIPGNVVSTLVSDAVCKHVRTLRTSDPFWACTFCEMLQLREAASPDQRALSDSLFTVSLAKKQVGISDFLATSVEAWIRHPQHATAKAVRESIARDRATQEAEITRQVKAEVANVAECKKEKVRLEKEIAPLQKELDDAKASLDDIVEEIKRLGGAIDAVGIVKEGAKKFAKNLQGLIGKQRAETRGDARKKQALQKQQEELAQKYNEHQANKEKIEGLERQLASLRQQVDEQEKKIAHSLHGINGGEEQLLNDPASWQAGGIARNIRTNPDYWPWGIGEHDKKPTKWADAWAPWGEKVESHPLPVADAPWNSQQVAAFFLASQALFEHKLGRQELMPEEFRTFADTSMLARNIFFKRQGKLSGHITLELDNKLQLSIEDLGTLSCDEALQRPDFYQEELVNNQFKELYTYVYNRPYRDDPEQKDPSHLLELHIPHVVGKGIKDSFPQQAKAPTMIEAAAAQAGSMAEKVVPGFAVKAAGAIWGGVKKVGGAIRSRWRSRVALNDEIRDLCQLRSAKGMQIDSAISYFQENPKKLFDADSRLLFHSLLFDSNLLVEAFQNERTQALVADRLRSLFHDVIDSVARLKDDPNYQAEAIETYANIIWLAAAVQNCLNYCPLQEKTPPILSVQDLVNFTKSFADYKYEEYLPAVFEAQVAAAGLLFEGKTETEEEKQLFAYGLLGRVIQTRYPPVEESVPAFARRSDAVFAEAKMMAHLPSVDPNLVAELLNNASPDVLGNLFSVFAKARFLPGKESGVFKTEDQLTTLSLTDASITSKDPNFIRQYTNSLPKRVLDLLVEQKLFTDVASCMTMRCYMEGTTCCIYDKEHNLYLRVKGNDIFVSFGGQAEEKWYNHIYPKVELKEHELLGKYHQWADADTKKTYLVDKNTLKPAFETDKKNNITKVIGTTTCTLVAPTKDSLLNDFEYAGTTLYWANDKSEVQEIEFPRLGLTLERAGDRFIPKGMKGWEVSHEQFLPHLERTGGFLVLENSETKEKKVLFPLWDIKADGSYDFSPNTEFGRTVECSIVRDTVVPKTVEARYFLTKLFLANGRVEEAAKLLYAREAHVTSRKLASRQEFDLAAQKLAPAEYEKAFRDTCRQEVELLKSIFMPLHAELSTESEIRLKMYGLYLLKKNEEQFIKEALQEDPRKRKAPASIEDIKSELRFVEAYLASLADKNPIDPADELLVLEHIVDAYTTQRYIEAINPQSEALEQDPTVRLQMRIRLLKEKVEAARVQEAIVPKERDEKPSSVDAYEKLFGCHPKDVKDFTAALDKLKIELQGQNRRTCIAAICAILERTEDPEVRKAALELLKGVEHEKVVVPSQDMYNSARLEKRFPFNPRNVGLDEFVRYAAYLYLEVKKTESIQAAEANGLLGALTTIQQSCSDQKVLAGVKELLSHLNALAPKNISTGLYPLAALQSIATDRGLTQRLRGEYYVKHEKMRPEVEERELLPANSPEVGSEEVTRQKFRETSEDIKEAQKRVPPDAYSWKEGKNPVQLRDELLASYTQEMSLLAHQETVIVNSLALALNSDPKKAEGFAKRTLFYPTIDEIGFMCARKDYDAYVKKHYPELTEDGRKHLQEAVKKYLIQKEAVQQLNRSVKNADSLIDVEQKIQKASTEASVNQLREQQKAAQDALAIQLDKVRAYPEDHPFAMLFLFLETALDIKLRSDQVQNILKFASGIQMDKSLVLQMIMGSGKTAVIMPFLAILLAKPEALSTIMVPESLFSDVRDSLTNALGKAADQMLVSLPYDIELSQDIRYLDTVLERLKETQGRGGALLISPRQKHSMLTSLYEAYYSLSDPSVKESRIQDIHKQLAEARKYEAKDSETRKKNEEFYATQLDAVGDNEQKKLELELAKEASMKVIDERAKKRQERVEQLEARLEALSGENLELRIAKISEICTFLQKNESVQIDEIDMVMNPNVIFKRPIGIPQVFDAHEDKSKAHARSLLLTELLLDLAEDKELNKEVAIDFVDQLQRVHGEPLVSRGVPINEQLFKDKVQPKLIEMGIRRLMGYPQFKELLASQDAKKIVARFILQQDVQDADKKWLEANITDPEAQNLLSAVGHAITNVLSTSLLRECNTNYGKDKLLVDQTPAKRRYVARPYAAPDNPKPTMYADPHEKIVYSVQYYLYNGIPLAEAEAMLIKWQTAAKKEMNDSVGLKLDQTDKYQAFKRVMDQPGLPKGCNFLADPRSKEFAEVALAFQKAISKDRESIVEFCKDHLFDQVTVYKKNVTSTPQTLVGSSNQALGYTGTMHAAILGPSMEAVADKGTDGMTISAMKRKFASGAATVTALSKEAKPPEEVIAQFMDPEYYVCIDSGNWLKEERLEVFAEKLLARCAESGKRPEIEGIVYHDANGLLVCLEKNETGKLSVVPYTLSRLKLTPEKRLTIIRSKNETGTDILQKPTAKAFMTVRKNMTLRDMLQSAFRMRGILAGQSVSLRMTQEVNSHIAQSVLKSLLSTVSREAFSAGAPINKERFIQDLKGIELSEGLKTSLESAIDQYNSNKKYTLLDLQECFTARFEPDDEVCLRYFTANLANVELEKNWAATRYKMRDTLEKPLRTILTDTSLDFDKRFGLFKHPKVLQLLVQEDKDSRFSDLLAGKSEIDREEAVRREQTRFINLLKELLNDGTLDKGVREQLARLLLPEEEREQSQELEKRAVAALQNALKGCVNLEELPKKIRSAAADDKGGELEVEREAEVEKEQELEAEVQIENDTETQVQVQQQAQGVVPPDARDYTKLVDPVAGHANSYDINKIFEARQQFKSIGARVPKELKLPGRTVLQYSQNFITDGNQLDSAEHAKNHLSSRYMLLLRKGDEVRYILVSNVDADKIKEGISKGSLSQGLEAVLCDLNGGVIEQKPMTARKLLEEPDTQSVMLQARFLTAKAITKSAEVKMLAKLIKEADASDGHLAACKKYYKKCLGYLETVQESYEGGLLEKMLDGKYPGKSDVEV